jgi:hypothetical protein
MGIARDALPDYASPFSKRDFTQPQLLTILILRQFFRTDYRGMIQMLHDFPNLQTVLKLKKVPHYSTLCYAEQRLLKKGLLTACWTRFSTRLEPAA